MTRRPLVVSISKLAAQRAAEQRVIGRGWSRRAANVLAVAVALMAATAPQSASAQWTRVSLTRSDTQPYFVCPLESDRPQCETIEDPIRGSQNRGPVSAGAITTGPELQVSPALRGNGVEGGYSPENLRDAYDLPSKSAGSGQTVAVVDAYDDPNAESDLQAYRSEYGIPECTASDGCFRKVNQTGEEAAYPKPEPSWASEISLDLDMVSAICPNCHILLVEATTNSSSDFATAENEAAALKATEISNSFGGPTLSEPPADASAYDHPGIPITAAGGDHGYGVESPASNPHVIAVGGTTLVPASTRRGWSETVWYNREGGELLGTGSGCSEESKPAWQTDSGCPYRTTNDIAAVADPNTPVSVYDSYQTQSHWRLLGGTSVATPIIAAAMALANPYTKSFEGAKALYLEAGENGTGALDDVVSGSNGNCGNYLCQAGPGYDGPTGLGSLWGVPEALPPTAVTKGATSVAQTEAVLSATVNPNGADVDECSFEYGTTTSYGSSVRCASLPGSGTSPVTVSASLGGLSANTAYHFRIAVEYATGSGQGADLTFTTTPTTPPTVSTEAPSVSTEAPSAITQTSASLNAIVDPNGGEVSECQFEFGTTTEYGSSAPCTPSPGTGRTSVAVSASITGLAAGATYHFRIAAANQGGISYSSDQTLTMLAENSPVAPEAPSTVVTPAAPGLLPTTPPLSPIQRPPAPAPDAELVNTTLAASAAGALTITVRCPAGESSCIGTITLRTLSAVSAGAGGHQASKHILTLATGPFRIIGGRVATVKLRLSAGARSLLARSRVLRARAIIAAIYTTGAASATQTTVTIHALKSVQSRTG
jgi:hypothetical protein